MIAGDPRARAGLLSHLKPALHELVVTVDAEVPVDSAAMAEAAEAVTARFTRQAAVSRFGIWHSRMADGTAAEGLTGIIAALADGRAAEVFLADDPGSAVTAWIGPGGTELAQAPQTLADRGVATPVRDRADAAIVRAIAGTDAELFFLPDDAEPPADGIGATLRY